jgi:hypothetical protein
MRNPALKQLDLFDDVPPAGNPTAPPLDEAQLQRELANTRQHVRNLIVMGMRPWLTAEKREFVCQLERSARAEVKLRIKALRHFQERGRQ